MKILAYCFICICTIILCNLNGVAYLFFNISAPFSPILLAFCLYLIFNLRKYDTGSLTISGYAFSGFFVLFLLIGMIVPIFYPYYEADYLEILRSYLSSAIIIYLFYKYTIFSERNESNSIIKYISTFLFIASIITLIADFTGLQNYGNYKAGTVRVSGLFANPNEAGVIANLMLIFLLVSLNLDIDKLKKLFIILGIIISFYCAIITYSKTAIILSVIILGAYFIIPLLSSNENKKSGKLVFIISIIILSTIVAPEIQNYYHTIEGQLHPNQKNRMDELFQLLNGTIDENTTGSRTDLAAYAFDLIAERPGFGYGLGTFQRLPGKSLGAHNTYLMIWGEAGILPILLYLLFYIIAIWEAFQIKNSSHKFLILSTLVVVFSSSLVNHNTLDDRTIDAVLGIILGVIKINKQNVWDNRTGRV